VRSSQRKTGAGSNQWFSVDGFGQVVISTGGNAFFAVTFHRVRRQCDDGQRMTGSAYRLGHAASVQDRHLHFHQSKIRHRCGAVNDGNVSGVNKSTPEGRQY
jgi:hypothetical protein